MLHLQRRAAYLLKAAAFALVVLVVSLFYSLATKAQTVPDSVSITVSPQSLDTAVNPGQSTTHIFRLTNNGEQSLELESTPKNFVPRGNEGAISIEEEDTPYSLAKWLSVEPSGPVKIEAKQTTDFKVTINVPGNADPGGHFGSVVFRTLPSTQEGTAASISQEVAPVILVRVPGDAKEQVSISSFRTPNTSLSSDTAIEFETIVKNEGNVHVKPTGTIAITNTFGKQVSSVEIESNNVIPGAERKMDGVWEDPGFRIGRYTARLTMVYGNENRIITAQTSFIIFPVKQVVPILMVLAILLFVIYRIRDRLLLAARVLAGKQEDK